jgi:tripartite-type tricarboxylate transporter receptor subunit TctC
VAPDKTQSRIERQPISEDRMKRFNHCLAAFGAAIMNVIVIPSPDSARAQADDWPRRPMTLVVPFAAGGSSDIIARIVAEGIGSNLISPLSSKTSLAPRA